MAHRCAPLFMFFIFNFFLSDLQYVCPLKHSLFSGCIHKAIDSRAPRQHQDKSWNTTAGNLTLFWALHNPYYPMVPLKVKGKLWSHSIKEALVQVAAPKMVLTKTQPPLQGLSPQHRETNTGTAR